jgi:hypothetical protein
LGSEEEVAALAALLLSILLPSRAHDHQAAAPL